MVVSRKPWLTLYTVENQTHLKINMIDDNDINIHAHKYTDCDVALPQEGTQ